MVCALCSKPVEFGDRAATLLKPGREHTVHYDCRLEHFRLVEWESIRTEFRHKADKGEGE